MPLLLCARMLVHFTDQNFKTETAKGIVVVDMYADWCGPCRMMTPIYEELSKEYEGKVKMGKLNVDKDPETPGAFGVSSIPTILFFQDGKEVARLIGFQPKEIFVKKFKELGVK